MFKLELKYDLVGKMHFFTHELGLLLLRLNILGQNLQTTNINGGV